MSPTSREYSMNSGYPNISKSMKVINQGSKERRNDYLIDNKTESNIYLRLGRKKDSINLD